MVYLVLSAVTARAAGDVVIENGEMRLIIGSDARARSLVHKPTGEECLDVSIPVPAFTLTQYRPYNNELQLAMPARSTAFPADRVRREGDRLIVDFDAVDYRAFIRLRVTDDYLGFTLERLEYRDTPGFRRKPATPVDELCFLQLPVKTRRNFGEWLNVLWDERLAVNLLATGPYTKIDGAAPIGSTGKHLFSAAAVDEVKMEGVGAALVATSTATLLDRIARVETDFDLPRGVESRRRPEYRYSYYELVNVTPRDIDEHIGIARRAGFRAMMVYNRAFARSIGHFDFKPEYPRGIEDLREMVRKIKAAGMTPGLHFHYTKAEKNDPYVEGRPDPRLNLTQSFTLRDSLDSLATSLTVEENPRGAPIEDERRYLRLGDELLTYESYTTERPYRFLGLQRGRLKTTAVAHGAGIKLGLLDVDTWPIFVRFDQRTSIQQEVAERIGRIYREAGFEFVYFDGAEDVHPPYWFTVSWPQLTVYRELAPAPLLAEGACKSHFSWHLLTRGNAFDVFAPEVMKAATRANPAAEAARVALDFTSINFGWIGYWSPGRETIGTQPDMLEYVASRAAGWDAPVSLNGELAALRVHPRTSDNLEVLRRWEQARLSGWLTASHREALRDPDVEHTLLVNEAGEYELAAWSQIERAAGGDVRLRAFVFERRGKVYVAYWHTSGAGSIEIDLPLERWRLHEELGREAKTAAGVLPVGKRRYLEVTGIDGVQVVEAFKRARLREQ
jgi:hypothetical protein